MEVGGYRWQHNRQVHGWNHGLGTEFLSTLFVSPYGNDILILVLLISRRCCHTSKGKASVTEDHAEISFLQCIETHVINCLASNWCSWKHNVLCNGQRSSRNYQNNGENARVRIAGVLLAYVLLIAETHSGQLRQCPLENVKTRSTCVGSSIQTAWWTD